MSDEKYFLITIEELKKLARETTHKDIRMDIFTEVSMRPYREKTPAQIIIKGIVSGAFALLKIIHLGLSALFKGFVIALSEFNKIVNAPPKSKNNSNQPKKKVK